MKRLEAGDTAPAFTLKNQQNQDISLADYKGEKKALVYFYPKAMTPGCTVQAQGLRDIQAELKALDVVVMGVSPDAPARLEKFEQKHELNFHLLADEDHALADQFGVWGPKKFMGKEYDGIHRISFLIGTDGKVEKVFDKFKTKNHHEVVLEYLKG